VLALRDVYDLSLDYLCLRRYLGFLSELLSIIPCMHPMDAELRQASYGRLPLCLLGEHMLVLGNWTPIEHGR